MDTPACRKIIIKCFHLLIKSKRPYCKSALQNLERQNSSLKISTLFVPGHYGQSVYQIVKPSIDVDYITANLDEIKYNCKLRGIQIDTTGFKDAAARWGELKKQVIPLAKIYDQNIRRIQNFPPGSDEYKEISSVLDQDLSVLRKLREELYALEDLVMPIFRSLPNKLHCETPIDSIGAKYSTPVHNFDFKVQSHSVLGEKMKCLRFSNVGPTSYYLTGILALLELAMQNFISSNLEELGFIPLSGTDFAKSFLFEAGGKDPHFNDDCITIQGQGREMGQQSHLAGSSSLETLCAYLVNMRVEKAFLPLRYYTLGRSYNPSYWNKKEKSLFHVVQSNSISGMIISDSCADECFAKFKDAITSILTLLDLPFSVINVPAKDLNIVESRKVQFSLWSPHLKQYVPCSNVSQYDDFVSRRLKMTYGVSSKESGYLNIVHGSFITIPVLIGCMMENKQHSNQTFSIPNILQDYMDNL